ncbi:MAG: hypothetical protein ACLT0Y_04175 [Christensenellales bacterium]
MIEKARHIKTAYKEKTGECAGFFVRKKEARRGILAGCPEKTALPKQALIRGDSQGGTQKGTRTQRLFEPYWDTAKQDKRAKKNRA